MYSRIFQAAEKLNLNDSGYVMLRTSTVQWRFGQFLEGIFEMQESLEEHA